jgi:hypothetical protein
MRQKRHKTDRQIRLERRETQILETRLLGRKKGVLLGTARCQTSTLSSHNAMTHLCFL